MCVPDKEVAGGRGGSAEPAYASRAQRASTPLSPCGRVSLAAPSPRARRVHRLPGGTRPLTPTARSPQSAVRSPQPARDHAHAARAVALRPVRQSNLGETSPPVRRAGFAIGIAALVTILLLDPPAGMPLPAWRVAAVAALLATWWVTEAIPISATALVPLLLFPVLGVASMNAAAAPYANPVIFLFLSGFLLAAALQRVGLHRRLALAIVAAVGTRPDHLVLGFITATAAVSMWVSNTATVVMLLPLATPVLELLHGDGDPAKHDGRRQFEVALLLGIAYAASIGGLGTLIGTPPNALLAGFMAETHGTRIEFGRWMLVGVPLVLIGIPATWLVLTRVMFRVPKEVAAGTADALRQQRMELGPISRGEWMVGAVVALAAASWIMQPVLERIIPGLTEPGIGIAAALLLFMLPIGGGRPALDWKAAEGLPWGVLVLFGGGLSLAAAIQGSGLSTWLGESLGGLRVLPLWLIVVIVATVVVFLSELTSNTATAAAFLPLSSSLAVGIGADPIVLALPTALAASIGFMMPVGTPPNALVFGTGRIRIAEMVRAGLLLNLVMIAVVSALSYWMAGVVVQH